MELVYIDLYKGYSMPPLVATLGVFDGLHKGHIALLEETLRIGQKENLKTAVITFDPHPDIVIGKGEIISYITPFEIKRQIIKDLGFDYLFVIKFTKDVMNTLPITFVENYLLKLNVVHTVVGYDFTFGKKAEGKAQDITFLSGNRIQNTIINKIELNKKKVSSIDVKEKLECGEIEEANILLGRPYEIRGEVIYGKQIGQTISVPTANISYGDSYIALKTGVYATTIIVEGEEYPSITNIGHNPSFNFTKKRSLETHIINFNKNIYGQNVIVKFHKHLRDEVKFSSVVEFVKQINIDKENALKIINH